MTSLEEAIVKACHDHVYETDRPIDIIVRVVPHFHNPDPKQKYTESTIRILVLEDTE